MAREQPDRRRDIDLREILGTRRLQVDGRPTSPIGMEKPMVVALGWLSVVALCVATVCYEFDALLSLLHR